MAGKTMIAAIDTHAHVFRSGLRLARGRRYTPDYDAPLDAFRRRLDAQGISRAVLVQPSFLGTDNSFMLEALSTDPARLRGIAVVNPDSSRVALARLAAIGVVGIRLNLIGAPLPDLTSRRWRRLLHHLIALDWQVEVHREARDLPQVLGPLLQAGVNVVVDHFGRPDPTLGIDDPGFRYLLTLGTTGCVWIKLSGAYRNGLSGVGETFARAAVPLLRDAFGWTHLIWGSDWPHTQFEHVVDYATVRRQIDAWIPEPRDRATVLADTPARLFRF